MKQIYLKLSMLLLCLVAGMSAWAEDVTATIEGTSMLEGTTPSTSYADHTTGITDSDENVWIGRWTYQKSGSTYMNMIQIKKVESSNTSRIQLPTFQGNIKKITIKSTDASSTNFAEGTGSSTQLNIVKGTAYTANEAKKTDNIILKQGSSSTSTKEYIFDFTSLEQKYTGEDIYIVSMDAAIRIWGIEVVYEKVAKVNVTSISIDKSNLSLFASQSAKLTATVLPVNATNKKCLWSSSNNEVATVENGLVVAKSAGNATITVKTVDGEKSATCMVTVSNPIVTGSVYKKITDNVSDWSGKYLFVYEDESVALDGSLNSGIDIAANTINVTISGDKIYGTNLVDPSIIEVVAVEGGYALKTKDGYYIGISSASNGLKVRSTEPYVNNLEYNSTLSRIEVSRTFADGTLYLCYNSNSSDKRFRYYKDHSQKNIQAYKLEEETPSSYTLTISAAGYATFYDSKNAYVMPEDCEGYVFTVANGLEAAYEGGEVVPAGEALVIKANAGNYTLNYTASSATPKDDNDLEGTDEATAIEADNNSYFYALSLDENGENIGFYWMNETGAAFINGAHKAYLKGAKASTSAKSFAFNAATAIKSIATSKETKIYDMTGREVKTPKAGLYIVNGVKKYIK